MKKTQVKLACTIDRLDAVAEMTATEASRIQDQTFYISGALPAQSSAINVCNCQSRGLEITVFLDGINFSKLLILPERLGPTLLSRRIRVCQYFECQLAAIFDKLAWLFSRLNPAFAARIQSAEQNGEILQPSYPQWSQLGIVIIWPRINIYLMFDVISLSPFQFMACHDSLQLMNSQVGRGKVYSVVGQLLPIPFLTR